MKRKLSTPSTEEGPMSHETTTSGAIINLPKKARSHGIKSTKNNFPHNFLIMTREHEVQFGAIRSEAKDQEFINEMLKENTQWRIKTKLWKAFKNSYKVEVDYRSWAKQRDSSDPESSTFTARNTSPKPGPLREIIRSIHSPEKEMVEIKEREGMVVEGDDGVPLLILLTSVQWQSMKEEMTSAGAKFSNTYTFRGSNPRSNFRVIEDSPFTAGYVKHSVGWATGHLTTRAMIHNDVVQDHAPADPVKGTAIPKNEVPLTPAAKQQLRTKKLAVEKAKLVNREHATTGKYSCLSPRDIQSAKCFDELFHTANKALHIVNLVLELIDPEFALSCHELSKSLKNDVDKYGHHLSRSECHLPGVVFHWNVDAKAVDQWHTDRNSAFGGWDAVISNGPNNGRFEVREIGVSIDFREGDLLLLRGAALTHRAGDWSGKGRFMTVPFCDRRLFNAQRVGGKMNMPALYGSKWADLRHQNWYKPFPGSEAPIKPKKSSYLWSKVD